DDDRVLGVLIDGLHAAGIGARRGRRRNGACAVRGGRGRPGAYDPRMDPRCPLCRTDGGELVWRAAACRVVLVAEPGLPGYARVVWNMHVRELSDLSSGELAVLWRTVAVVERAVRACLRPEKVNV